jgi:hypothetical protein
MPQEADQNASDTAFTVLSLLLDMVFSMTLQEVAHLGIADMLRDGPKPVRALAQEAGVQEDVLLLCLRVLCSKEIFVETAVEVFAHTEASRHLQTNPLGSMLDMAEIFRAEWQRMTLTPEALTYTLQTGQPAIEHVLGENLWSYLTRHPSEYATFNRAMTSVSVLHNEAVAQACDLTGLHSLVDLGGGEGSFLSTLLLLHPEMRGTLFDIAPVVERARALIAQTGLTQRCTCIAGDFLERVPEGGDAYLIKQVMHNWSNENALRILRNCRQAIAPGGKLFIIEYILPEPPSKPSTYLTLSVMLRQIAPGGYQRTVQQLRDLLNDAGFEYAGITQTNAPQSVLEARVRH